MTLDIYWGNKTYTAYVYEGKHIVTMNFGGYSSEAKLREFLKSCGIKVHKIELDKLTKKERNTYNEND
tara:strand:- start:440 stop:643 length:204 start_codon:yes stop_codon:yes gene_type:complete